MAKTALQRFEFTRRVIRICSRFVGADVLNENYRPNILTVLAYVCLCVYFYCTGYTVYKNIYIDGRWTDMLKTLCMISSGLQGYSKITNAILNKVPIRYLVNDLHSIYKEYSDKHFEYRKCLSKSMNTTDKSIRILGIIYVIATSSLIIMVFVYRFAFHQRIYVLQFEMPHVDVNTEHGYLITNWVHFTCISLGAFGNYAADLALLTCISNAPLYKDILKCKFHDLNEVLKRADAEQMKRCHMHLKDIFQFHQRYIKFVDTVRENYFWVIAVEMFTVAFSIALTLFCLILGTWPNNDNIIESCYTEVIWYQLTPRDRKMLQTMLMMTQNSEGLTIGSVIPLTMDTGLQWTKTIYSMTIMLINFLD
ncbi:odorant receptor 67d-like [Musca vetustissima]|uniref:odorant receptor 67d-like n=1 Tax=Musca vetustissima TaxID=27455 RepID=UPI002AB782FA|nr:odorant receptor 67d-like [Musca vetustissima]